MTERFKDLYINEDGEVGLTNDGLLMVGTIKDLENLLNTLDEKNKGLQVTTELINEIKDELLTLHGKEIPINYNNKYRDENFKFNYYTLIRKLNEALIKGGVASNDE